MQDQAKKVQDDNRVMDISALPESMRSYAQQVLAHAGWRLSRDGEQTRTAIGFSAQAGWQLMRDGHKVADIRLPVRAGAFITRLSRLMGAQNPVPDRDIVFANGCRLVALESVFVFADGQAVRLTEKEVAILLCLHAQDGNAVTREKLLENVWAYAPDVETHTLETHIYRLRQKIELVPGAPVILLTVENGYALGLSDGA